MAVLVLIIVISIIIVQVDNFSVACQDKKAGQEAFKQQRQKREALWRKQAKENNWYYGPECSCSGPEWWRNADGTPKDGK